jgi:hypothetical protein
MRRPNYTEEDHKRRAEQFWELVRRHRNLTLKLIETHLNPYSDLSTSVLKQVELSAKNAFLDALPKANIPVLIHADAKTRASISFEYAECQKSRGDVVRLIAKDRRWFEHNWDIFSCKQMEVIGSGLRRQVFIFINFDQKTLAGLAAPWWDPNVLTNPHSVIKSSILKEVHSRIEPGMVAVSFIFHRMSSCQLYFHADDVEAISRCVYAAANKTEWAKVVLD